jgi:hypothetical protein
MMQEQVLMIQPVTTALEATLEKLLKRPVQKAMQKTE